MHAVTLTPPIATPVPRPERLSTEPASYEPDVLLLHCSR